MAKIHIDLSRGIFEVDGEPDFVRGIFDDFKADLNKLSSQIKSSRNDNLQLPPVRQDDTANTVIHDIPETNILQNKKKIKRSVKSPPKGHSCSDRIIVLRKKEFFKAHKTTSEIVQGLAKEGWTHTINQVSASIILMFNRGDIQRTNAGKGFTYYWDRD